MMAGACVVSVFFGIRWQLGMMLAELTPPTDENAAEIAATAIAFAPGYYGGYRLRSIATVDAEEAINALKDAVRMSPFDADRRIELARAYERAKQPEQAEREFRYAVALAPNHAMPRWHLGNFLLRRGAEKEAMEQLKAAAANSRKFREQVFSLIWDISGKDPSAVETTIGGSPDAIAHMAYLFASRGEAAASLRNWNRLDPEFKAKNAVTARGIADGLYAQKRFAEALEFYRQLGLTDALANRVTNGSFESELPLPADARFDWEVYRNEAKVEASIDTRVRRTGERSIRLTFRGYSKPAFYNISQIIAVEPETEYILRFFVRADNLQSAGTPFLAVSDVDSGRLLAGTEPFATGSYEWKEITVSFLTPAGCRGIMIRLLRKDCGENCVITGSFWLDDFELQNK